MRRSLLRSGQSPQAAGLIVPRAAFAPSLLLPLSTPVLAGIDAATGRWSPGIGDPTIAGWLTVVVYATVAVVAAGNMRLARAAGDRAIWWLVAALLAFLAVNKQLDLQTWVTQVGRDIAIDQGWYERRRPVQVLFIAMLATFALLGVALARISLKSAWRSYRFAIGGLSVLLFFLVARAATLTHVDRLLKLDLGFLRLNNVFELGALLLLGYGVLHWRRTGFRANARPS